MALFRRAGAVLAMALLPFASDAFATPGECHVVDVNLRPASHASPGICTLPSQVGHPVTCPDYAPQIVVWIEKPNGEFVDTIFITSKTGTYGIGNRPGRPDFNSGPRWPYGYRPMVFPVWADRKLPREFDAVVFQNIDENNLSHPFNESSRELAATGFCRPLGPAEDAWDTGTCASTVYTDKGTLAPIDSSGNPRSIQCNEVACEPGRICAAGQCVRSKYPPRQDLMIVPDTDADSVSQFADLNPFDAVSQATPELNTDANISWPIPSELPVGEYVMWVEVSKEFDINASYTVEARPSPTGIPWADYGVAFRGQPSVVYRIPFTLGSVETTTTALDYAGYGDPDGLDGNLRAPDNTITTDVPGSGASRLAIVADGGTMFRVRVTARPEYDYVLPGPASAMLVDAKSRSATVTFSAPGDDGLLGRVKGYEVRYRIGGDPITDANFLADGSYDPHATIAIGDAGTSQSFSMEGLLPETEYSVGIRAFDDCRNIGPLNVVTFRTAARLAGEVDACFIATAAYGSALANDVELLRHYRDALLRSTVLGELAIEAYYTFSPPVAGIVGESELLRNAVRSVLSPVVRIVRTMVY